jgi:hypothetical protein
MRLLLVSSEFSNKILCGVSLVTCSKKGKAIPVLGRKGP